MIGWVLAFWICGADGECRPVDRRFDTRGACLIAERQLRAEADVRAAHCRHDGP